MDTIRKVNLESLDNHLNYSKSINNYSSDSKTNEIEFMTEEEMLGTDHTKAVIISSANSEIEKYVYDNSSVLSRFNSGASIIHNSNCVGGSR